MEKITFTLKNNEEKVIPFIWINDIENQYDVSVHLKGEGARVHLLGLFLGSRSNSLIFNTNVYHEALKTHSRTTIRGVFRDNSKFTNDGLVSISKGAKGADGFFESKILLFENAKGKSVPSLEIDENDLKAGHASTIGRPDPEQFFFLKSRGISEKEAEKLIIVGFFEPILSLLPLEQRREIKEKILSLLSL